MKIESAGNFYTVAQWNFIQSVDLFFRRFHCSRLILKYFIKDAHRLLVSTLNPVTRLSEETIFLKTPITAEFSASVSIIPQFQCIAGFEW